jgi:epoxyqueuosine reductase
MRKWKGANRVRYGRSAGDSFLIDTFGPPGYIAQVMQKLTNAMKLRARQLGFNLVGATQPHPSDQVAFYRNWLAQGYHAGMGYLARPDAIEKRADPRRVMPEARSIIVAGMSYYPGEFPPVEGHLGRVSRYAWGADYHDVILGKLHQLAEWIDGMVEHRLTYRAYVDTGPLLERELAQRAGLGWIGKNTNLIHPRMGSYLFLGDLLLDLELEPDTPFSGDRCGSCTACLDACPTGALTAARTLDARRCISYLTIEHRGSVPQEMRPLMDDWVFGCDVCQEVCPWNLRFARPAQDPALRPVRATLDLVEMLALDKDAFRERFRGTPLWRARRAGLLRNAAVVLGNLGDPAAGPALRRSLADPEPLVAEHAAWALSSLAGPREP